MSYVSPTEQTSKGVCGLLYCRIVHEDKLVQDGILTFNFFLFTKDDINLAKTMANQFFVEY